jgi:hypothetical protein
MVIIIFVIGAKKTPSDHAGVWVPVAIKDHAGRATMDIAHTAGGMYYVGEEEGLMAHQTPVFYPSRFYLQMIHWPVR